MSSIQVHVKSPKITFEKQSKSISWSVSKKFIFLKRPKNQFKMLSDMSLPWKVLLNKLLCLGANIKREWQKLLGIASRQNVLSRFEYYFRDQKHKFFSWWLHTLWLRQWRTVSFFEEMSPPVTISHNQTCAKKMNNHSNYGTGVSTSHWLTQLTKHSFPHSFYTSSIYNKAARFFQSPTTVLSGLSTSDKIYLFWLWKIPSESWLSSSSILKLVVVTNLRAFEQSFGASCNYPQPARH